MTKLTRMLWKRTTVALVTASLALPQAALAAGPQPATGTKQQVKVKVSVTDVSLSDSGRLTGQLVDHDGKPVSGGVVKVHQNNQQVAQTVADKQGMFKVSGLKPGVYAVTGPNAMSVARAWSREMAPPQAKPALVLVNHEQPLVRGQYGFLEPGYILLLGTSTAALVLGAVAVDKIDDVDDRVIVVPSSP